MTIESFYQDDRGDLFMMNGLDEMLRWDGLSNGFESVGMDAPLTALTLGGSGSGAIVGDYTAYLRFVDAIGNVSNLNPISNDYTAQGTSGTITNATNASPISITSVGHGLATGTTVKIEGVGGNTSANNTWVITVVDGDTFTLDESHGTAAYNGGGTWISGVSVINYTNVPVPTETKVVRRQILRNTDGQALTYYVDVDTTNLTSTSLSSTRVDSDLSAEEAVPILDSSNRPFANRHYKPSSFYAFLSHHLGRMFQYGTVEYSKGHCKVVSGSTTVTGVGTKWKDTFVGRFIYVDGAARTYEVATVDETAQTLTLTVAYEDATDKFAFYSIKPPPAYRNLIAFSNAGDAQSYDPAFDVIQHQETGDDSTGIMQMGAYIFMLQKRHIHKLTFANHPVKDGAIFMVAERGCINNRCWVVVDESAFMLDDLGIHRFEPTAEIEHVSGSVQSIFRLDDVLPPYRVNWKFSEYFHAAIDRQRETIRWHVSMDGNRYPKQVICLEYRTGRWWIEGLPVPIGGTCFGLSEGLPQLYYGGQHAKVLAAWKGPLDIARPGLGTVRNYATAATAFTLLDSLASYASTGMVNAPLAIVHGKGKGQIRRIVAVSGTQLKIDMPWSEMPDTTSIYQIGGIHWKFRSSWFRMAATDNNMQRRFEFMFEPLVADAYADFRFRFDFAEEAEKQSADQTFDAGGGIKTIKGDADMTVNMKKRPIIRAGENRINGIVQREIPGYKELFAMGRRYMQFELEGWTNEQTPSIYQFVLEGVLPGASLGANEGER